MVEKTKIFFSGVLEGPYPGAARPGCKATDPNAVSWHVGVGGTYCNFSTKEDFAAHFKDFLDLAYRAGVRDEQARVREVLGL